MNEDTNQPAMNGDDELAKTLSGGLKFEETPPSFGDNQQGDGSNDPATDDQGSNQDNSQQDDNPSGDDTPPTMDDMGGDDENSDSNDSPAEESHDDVPMIPPSQDDNDNTDQDDSSAQAPSDLDDLKSSALDDLKPLVGKLNLSPEEKFDTLLLIIRSTDDQSLLSEAHAAAKAITDDNKRAQALLDVIKEVDYFKSKGN